MYLRCIASTWSTVIFPKNRTIHRVLRGHIPHTHIDTPNLHVTAVEYKCPETHSHRYMVSQKRCFAFGNPYRDGRIRSRSMWACWSRTTLFGACFACSNLSQKKDKGRARCGRYDARLYASDGAEHTLIVRIYLGAWYDRNLECFMACCISQPHAIGNSICLSSKRLSEW